MQTSCRRIKGVPFLAHKYQYQYHVNRYHVLVAECLQFQVNNWTSQQISFAQLALGINSKAIQSITLSKNRRNIEVKNNIKNHCCNFIEESSECTFVVLRNCRRRIDVFPPFQPGSTNFAIETSLTQIATVPSQPHLHFEQKVQPLHVIQTILELWQDDRLGGKERPDRAVDLCEGAVLDLLDHLGHVGPLVEEGIVDLLELPLHAGGRAGEDWGSVEECEGRWWCINSSPTELGTELTSRTVSAPTALLWPCAKKAEALARLFLVFFYSNPPFLSSPL